MGWVVAAVEGEVAQGGELITDTGDAKEHQAVARSRNTRAGVLLEVLAVETVAHQPRHYLPVVLVVFSALDFPETRLSIVVDDMVSEPYGHSPVKSKPSSNTTA